MIQHLQQGDVFYDIGANVGFYTILAATLVGPGGSVYAFEPLPRNLSFLRQHINMNKFDNVVIYDVAVSDADATLKLEPSASPSMARLSEKGSVTVKSVTLDRLIAQDKLRIPTVLKIDIEGAEFAALKGAISLLRDHPVKLFLAVHSDSLREQCTQLLEITGYKVEPIHGFYDELYCHKQ